MLEKTLESPLVCKEIQPVNPKGNQSWIFIGSTDAEAETPILWPSDAKNWLIGKDPDAGKDWRWEEKEMTEGEMVVGWHHRLDGYEFEWTPGAGDGQGGLACDSWGRKESDTTERLNWTKVQTWIHNPLGSCQLDSPTQNAQLKRWSRSPGPSLISLCLSFLTCNVVIIIILIL